MSGITNKDLEKLSRLFLNKNFLGVFPCDVIPNSNKDNMSVIFNLSKHNEKGSHFIAIIKRLKKIIYFDSFGKECDNEDIRKYLRKFNLHIEYNKEQIQDNSSSLCGYYCFYFLYFCFMQNRSLAAFIKKFNINPQNLITNDTVLMKYITKVIEKNKT